MPDDLTLARRVSRLENETESIYEILTDVKSTLQTHDRRFDAIDQRLDRMDERFDRMDRRFDGMDERFDRMDHRFDLIEATLREVVRRLPESS